MNKNRIDFFLLGRVLRLAKPYKRVFIIAGILAIILAPIATARPLLIQIMVDDYIFNNNIPGLTYIALLIFGFLLLETILRYFFIFSTRWLGQVVIRDLRVRVFRFITNLRLSYFDKTAIGTSTTRTINDIETIVYKEVTNWMDVF